MPLSHSVTLSATGVVSFGSAEQDTTSRLILQFIGTSWVGSAIPKIRVAGGTAIADADLKSVPYVNFATGAAVAAGTAITADGIYLIPADGLEVVLDYTHTSGSALVEGNIVEGADNPAAAAAAAGLTDTQLRATPVPVSSTLAAGENHVGQVGGEAIVASANFTRPADTTAYASGDLVANSVTAGSVTPLSFTAARVAAGSFMVRRVRVKTSSTSVTTASFRLHLYAASPTVTNGDNGVWLSTQSTYLGALDVTVDKAFSDAASGSGAPLVGTEINHKLASGQTIYGLLEARAAYTPTSAEVFTIDLEILQN